MQLPGALQGLVVGLPFYALPAPEAPYLLLNILSFAVLCLLAWYCAKRVPEIPAWLSWWWLMTAPWTLDYSTQVLNLSYVLPGSILFFVSALETYPALSKHLVPLKWANFSMGLALFWVMQFHMSWVLLLPYTLASFYFQYRSAGKKSLISGLYFALGAALMSIFLIPTFLKYGVAEGLGGINSTISFSPANLTKFLAIPVRFLAFASYIIFDARFMGRDMAEGIALLKAQLWLLPFAIFLSIVGILQIVAMIALWFTKMDAHKDWPAIKRIALFTVCLVYVSFLFSIRRPFINTFYVTLPIAMIYSFYCWSRSLQRRGWQIFAIVFLACGTIFHAGLAAYNFSHRSLYMDRGILQSAIEHKDYRILGERRPGSRY